MSSILKKKSFFGKSKITLKYKTNSTKIKHKKVILTFQIGILIFFGGYFTGLPISSGQNLDSEYPLGLFNTVHLVENLRGDSIGLSKYWKLSQGVSLSVNILNPVSVSNESIEIIKESILSEETISIDDSLLHKGPKNSFSNYYAGWVGALKNTPDTKHPIPKSFEVKNSQKSNGDIVIILSNIKDRSGNTGYTKTILEGEQIVKAFITIYDVDSLSDTQLATIMRHEFGHALGLGHSTAPEDLMAPTIDMTYPYISSCNISAISELYNGDSDGTRMCEK